MTELDPQNPAAPRPDEEPIEIIGLPRARLAEAFATTLAISAREAKMRANQVWRWVYHYGATDFGVMTDIGKEMRSAIAARFRIGRPEVVERLVSSDGTQNLVRNLTAAEIVGQVMTVKDDLAEWPSGREDRKLSNIVFMGMGEPLYNLDNVSAAIDVIADGDGISISRRRTTVSTSGVVPHIQRLGSETSAMLAISLHATNDALRDVLVPINRKYPIAELMDACRAYPEVTNAKRITFEYVMLKGVNDSDAEARALVALLKGLSAKINLIPFNPWPGAIYECSSWERIEGFADIVNRAGYASPIRTPRGRDILAACGQLKSTSVRARASEKLKERLAAARA